MSSDQVKEIVAQMGGAIGANSGLGGTLKFDFGEPGSVYIDGKSTPNTVEDGEGKTADCTISLQPRNVREDGQERTRRHVRLHAGQASRRRRHGPRDEARSASSPRRAADTRVTALDTRFVTSRGGIRIRTTVWDAAPASAGGVRGVCVLLGGQTEFLEKYGEVAGELTARGFTVASFDWRGQGGSDRLLPDALKAHVADFSDYDADLAVFMDEIVRPLSQEPPIALAHSMGGTHSHARPA